LLVAAGCASPHPPATAAAEKPGEYVFPGTPQPVDAAQVRAGRERAQRDVAAGDPHLLSIGLPSAGRSPLDAATGLPTDSVGCTFNEASVSFVKGYNDATLEAVRSGAARTYAERATTADAVAARFAGPDVVELTASNAAVAAPGGKLRVELGTVTYSFDPPDEPPTPYLFVVDAATGERAELDFVGEMRARVAFDRDGSTLLVRDDFFRRTATYDLRNRRMLQQFSDAAARAPVPGDAK